MFINDLFCGFKLKQNHIINNDIGKIFANQLTVKIDLDRSLYLNFETGFSQGNRQSILINFFVETISQFLIYLEKDFKNIFTQIGIFALEFRMHLFYLTHCYFLYVSVYSVSCTRFT